MHKEKLFSLTLGAKYYPVELGSSLSQPLFPPSLIKRPTNRLANGWQIFAQVRPPSQGQSVRVRPSYRGVKKGLKILLSRTKAAESRRYKQEQKISRIILLSGPEKWVCSVLMCSDYWLFTSHINQV